MSADPPATPGLRINENEKQALYLIVHILKVSPFSNRQLLLSNVSPKSGTRIIAAKAVCLNDYNDTEPGNLMDQVDNLMFERLMMSENQLTREQESLSVMSIPALDGNAEKGAAEKRPLHYLYQCYHRAKLAESSSKNWSHSTGKSNAESADCLTIVHKLQSSIINQSYLHLNLSNDSSQNTLLSLIDAYAEKDNHSEILTSFLESVASRLLEESDRETVAGIFCKQLYSELGKRVSALSIIDVKLYPILQTILSLTSSPSLGSIFMLVNSPWKTGAATPLLADVLKTVMGRLLSISCLTRIDRPGLEFFSDAGRNADGHQMMENNIGAAIRRLVAEIKNIWHKILAMKEVKNDLMDWIGVVLFCLKDQSKLWTNAMAMEAGNMIQVTDGFANNLSNVLLLFCKPFASPRDPKLLKIDPRYSQADSLPLGQDSVPDSNQIHMRLLKEETFLSTADQSEPQIDMTSFKVNFMTEMFFMTHKSLEVGYKSCQERFLRLATDLNTVQRLYQDARAQSSGAGSSDPAVEGWKMQLEKGLTQFLSMKAVLGQQEFVENMIRLHVATASWLTNIAAHSDFAGTTTEFKQVDEKILLSKTRNPLLTLIPEFVMENISDTIIFIRKFRMEHNVSHLDLEPLMTVILMFMGSSERVKNPHLRAKFAEVLESLMPNQEVVTPGNMSVMSAFDFGSKLFIDHPHVSQLVPTLLNVFVSIELTGQAVAFEQKFQYRRPMYVVLKYLWRDVKHPHRERMIELASDAEANMDAADAPLFLRFVNLLMNDAHYLLDESLGYMKQLKEMQQAREAGEWSRMTEQQRAQQQANYQHYGRLARFHNVMGHDTIETLAWLTEEVNSIFCSTTLVDRVAAMLNYFLKFLVGSDKRNFKVKDMQEFEFKPADIVSGICLIYAHLSSEENHLASVFKKAVAKDERSYSAGLLELASDVLVRTGKSANGIPVVIKDLSAECDLMAQESRAGDIPGEDIPEEFQCAIMSDLMTDPVRLPSGNVVDRKTIARHLLSDQMDPFNRRPMTMDMVEPMPELKQKIEDFIKNYQRT